MSKRGTATGSGTQGQGPAKRGKVNKPPQYRFEKEVFEFMAAKGLCRGFNSPNGCSFNQCRFEHTLYENHVDWDTHEVSTPNVNNDAGGAAAAEEFETPVVPTLTAAERFAAMQEEMEQLKHQVEVEAQRGECEKQLLEHCESHRHERCNDKDHQESYWYIHRHRVVAAGSLGEYTATGTPAKQRTESQRRARKTLIEYTESLFNGDSGGQGLKKSTWIKRTSGDSKVMEVGTVNEISAHIQFSMFKCASCTRSMTMVGKSRVWCNRCFAAVYCNHECMVAHVNAHMLACHLHPGYWLNREITEEGVGEVIFDNFNYTNTGNVDNGGEVEPHHINAELDEMSMGDN